MEARDLLRFTVRSAAAHRLRSSLTALGIGIGVTAVVLLTSIGEGLHQYVLNQFTQFGTNIIAINSGRATTFGASPGMFNSVRPLTMDDSEALKRLPYVLNTVPVVQGTGSVEANGRERHTTVTGCGSDMATAFSFRVALGNFLPPDDPRAPRPLAVLGSKLRHELYGERNPLGETVRIGGERYRVVGVMEPKGQVLGFDLDDTVYIPTARALEMYNREGLFEIDVLYDKSASASEVKASIERLLLARHGGLDFTITTQEQMLDVLGSVLDVVTFAVAALGGISLLVGGVGIFTIMTIAVRERTAEIGLLRAVGAGREQVRRIFLGESMMLAALGGVGGLLAGASIVALLQALVPALPVSLSLPYAIAAELVAVMIGLVAGVLPAHSAAELDPVEALRAE
ncbi:MAG: FtsX-like permease family protein [Gammaproteobacteria bacterium]|nr:FtsX-like permease family protein [Gammaproteobacteria bacterium]